MSNTAFINPLGYLIKYKCSSRDIDINMH